MKVLDENGLAVLKQYLLAELPVIDPSKWTNNTIGSNNFSNIKVINNELIAVGRNGSIYTSTDGNTWTSHGSYTAHFNDVCYFKNYYILASGNGVYYGTDLDNLIYKEISTWNMKVCCASDDIVIVGGSAGNLYYSTDGVNWTKATGTGSKTFNSCKFINNLFIAIAASGVLITSIDGINWTEATTGTTNNLTDVCYDGSQYIVVGQKIILTSTDVINWETITNSTINNIGFYSVLYVDNKYIFACNSNKIYYCESFDNIYGKSMLHVCENIVCFDNGLYTVGSSGYIAVSKSTKKFTLQEVANYFMNKINK